MHGVLNGHPFIDGNKRTGYALAQLILQDAGLDISASVDERYDMVIQVATSQLDVDGIVAWMKERVVSTGL